MITTAGDVNADSYVSVEEADSIVESSVDRSAWPEDDEDKEAALIEATRIIDSQFRWVGVIASDTQALRWPRSEVYDLDGRLYPNTVIPRPVRIAVTNLAYFLIKSNGLNMVDSGVTRMRVGPIDMTFGEDSATIGIPGYIVRSLSAFGAYVGVSNGGIINVNAIRS